MTTITLPRATVEQALEALELVTDLTNHDDEIYEAITALRAALAEPQSTHSADCYQWHHACAVAEVERLRAALAEPVQRKPLTVTKLLPRKLPEDNDE